MMLSTAIPLDPTARATMIGDLMEQAGHARLQSLVSAQVMGALRDLGQADWRKVLAQQEVRKRN